MKKLALLACIQLCIGTLAAPADLSEVTAEGRAPGDAANARELALTDALREAVRKGAGVDVLSATSARDFTLDYDRVFAAAFGYVREYTVLKSRLGDDGIYLVEVRAKVGAGQPGTRDILALSQIVHLKQSPRVALEIDELVEGTPAGSDFCKTWFEAAAREMQLQLVDTRRTARQSDRLATRDEVFGNTDTERIRRAGIAQDADFIIQARVRGHDAGAAPYGLAGRTFSVAVDLRAVRPDSGQVVAAVAVPTRDIVSGRPTLDGAARDAVHRVLAGDAKTPGAADQVLRRVFAAWMTELDIGALIRLELAQVGDAEHDRLLRDLRGTEQITAVWPREFDSRGLTVVDVESRLDASGLKAAVLKILGAGFTFDHGTGHYLQFRRTGGAPADTAPAAATGALPPPPPRDALPPWVWAGAGAGAVLLAVGAFWLGRRGR